MKKYSLSSKISLLRSCKAFTLIEILIWISLFSIIITSWFYAFSAVSIWRIKLIWKTTIEKESYFFSERLFEEIKKWWLIDYEEYFNRKVVWDTLFLSWHYVKDTWFWNFWSGWNVWTATYWDNYYYCRSWVWDSGNMSSWTINPTWWCYDNNFNNYWASLNWKPQRFWEYTFQFMDYNSNLNSDITLLWDENADGNIVWDDDDESLWIWPEVFSNTWEVQELYLISWNKRTRTLLRWKVIEDPDKSPFATCSFTSQKTPTWSGCLWTIEFLKLDLKDWGTNHDKTTWIWFYDWSPDTWIINPDFAWTWSIIAWSNNTNYRVPLFPKSINVKDVNFFLYPNKDLNLAWKDSSISSNFSPYLRIRYTLTPSREKRKWIRWEIPELTFSTTITLSDLFSQK
jgi:hypothetical protein